MSKGIIKEGVFGVLKIQWHSLFKKLPQKRVASTEKIKKEDTTSLRKRCFCYGEINFFPADSTNDFKFLYRISPGINYSKRAAHGKLFVIGF